jgi:hypothetical protein
MLAGGLRRDIIGDDHDVNGDDTSSASVADLWGPATTGVGSQPGALEGPASPSMVAAVHQDNTRVLEFRANIEF